MSSLSPLSQTYNSDVTSLQYVVGNCFQKMFYIKSQQTSLCIRNARVGSVEYCRIKCRH